jgi:hypothetical protein
VSDTDPVGVAVWSVLAGAATGGVALTSGVLVIRMLQAGTTSFSAGAGSTVLGVSVFVAVGGAIVSAWIHTRTIDDVWRRGVSAAVAVMGAVLLAVPAVVADLVGGRVGIGAYLAALLLGAAWAHRGAGRLTGEPGAAE